MLFLRHKNMINTIEIDINFCIIFANSCFVLRVNSFIPGERKKSIIHLYQVYYVYFQFVLVASFDPSEADRSNRLLPPSGHSLK